MSKKQKILLISILAFAFLFRLAQIGYGLPQDLFSDELVHVNAAFNLLEQKTLRANFDFLYLPPLFSYILAPIFGLYGVVGILIGKFQNILDYKNFVLLNWGQFLIFSRIIAVIFGTATLYFLFLFTKRLFSIKIAYATSIFLAFDFLHFHESPTGRFWTLATFFTVAGAYFIYRLYESRQTKWYFWSALMIGLGFGIGYVPIILLPWFLVAHFLNKDPNKNFWKKFLDKKIIFSTLLIVVFVGFFIFSNTYGFNRQFGRTISTIFDFFGYKTRFSMEGLYTSTNILGNLKDTIIFLWYNNFIFLIAGILGILLLLWQNSHGRIRIVPTTVEDPRISIGTEARRAKARFSHAFNFEKFLIIGIPIIYLLVIAFGFSSLECRYILPAIPFLIIISIYFLYCLVGKIFRSVKYKNLFFVLFIILMIGYSAYISILYAQKLQRPDTRIQAIDWIYQNIPSGSKIISGIPRVWLNENKESIEFLKENSPDWFNARREYLLSLDEDQYPRPNYFVYNLNYLNLEKIDFEKIKADYYIFSLWNSEEKEPINSEIFNKELIAKFYPKEKFDDMKEPIHFPLIKPFATLGSIDYLGPYVEIYRLK